MRRADERLERRPSRSSSQRRRRAPVLPHDRAVAGPPGRAVPDDDGLALVRDADRRDRLARRARRAATSPSVVERRGPDLVGVVLDPARAAGSAAGTRGTRMRRTRPSSSTASVRTPVVPASIARTTAIGECGGPRCVGARPASSPRGRRRRRPAGASVVGACRSPDDRRGRGGGTRRPAGCRDRARTVSCSSGRCRRSTLDRDVSVALPEDQVARRRAGARGRSNTSTAPVGRARRGTRGGRAKIEPRTGGQRRAPSTRHRPVIRSPGTRQRLGGWPGRDVAASLRMAIGSGGVREPRAMRQDGGACGSACSPAVATARASTR